MTTIDRTKGFERCWGTFVTQTQLVQTFPGGAYKDSDGSSVNPTRTWLVNDARVPVVSGDSIRGILRRTIAYDMLERLGLERGKVPLSVGHLLIAGGGLGNMLKTYTQDNVANARHFVPSFALLGGTFLGGFFAGRFMAGSWVAQTRDTPSPALYVDDEDLPPASSTIGFEHFASLGTEEEEAWLDDGVGKLEVSTAVGKEDSKRTAGSAIPFSYKVVNPGVTFAGWVALGAYRGLTPEDDDVQRSCLRFGLEAAFRPGRETTLGLRSSQGYGVVSFDWDLSGISSGPEAYFDFLAENREDIASLLMSRDMVPKPDPAKIAQREARKAKKAESAQKVPASAADGAPEDSAGTADDDLGDDQD